MGRWRTESPAVRRVARPRSRGRVGTLDKLLGVAAAPVLLELVRRLAALSPEVERLCFEYLREHTANTPDARADAAAGVVHALWSEIDTDLSELDDYGGGDYDTQDYVGSLLYDLEQMLRKHPIRRDDRRALLDELLPYIRSGNAGMDDALYDVAYAACRDSEDRRDLALRFEALGGDWPIDHARRIYRQLGDRENYLRLRRRRMQYGADYHDLATFHWEQGERQQALEIAREGLKKAEGRMDELRAFLAKRAKAGGDRHGYLELQFAQAMDRPTLASYKTFRKLCTPREWPAYEPRVLTAVKEAWEDEQLKIHMHRNEYDQALTILTGMDYPDERYEDSEVLKVAARLEAKYPGQILTFYLSGLPERPYNPTRNDYARWAQAVRRAQHVWVDVLGTPTEWETFARKLKSVNVRRPAFQQEFAKAIPGWNQL